VRRGRSVRAQLIGSFRPVPVQEFNKQRLRTCTSPQAGKGARLKRSETIESFKKGTEQNDDERVLRKGALLKGQFNFEIKQSKVFHRKMEGRTFKDQFRDVMDKGKTKECGTKRFSKKKKSTGTQNLYTRKVEGDNIVRGAGRRKGTTMQKREKTRTVYTLCEGEEETGQGVNEAYASPILLGSYKQ